MAIEAHAAPSEDVISYGGIAKNTSFYFIAQVATWITSFLTISLIPRRIGETGMGQLALLSAAFSPVGALLWLGLESYLTKEIARDARTSERLLRACIGLRIALHIPGVSFSFLLLYLLHASPFVWWLGFWQILLAFPNAVSGLFRATQTAWEQAKRVSLLDTISNFTSLIAVPLLWLGPISIIIACFIMDLFLLIARIRWLRTSVSLYPTFDVRLWLTMIRGGIPFVLMGIVSMVYGLIGTFMLRHYTNDAALGVQGQATRLFSTFLFLPTVLTPALLPAIARIADSNPLEFRRAQQHILTLVIVLGMPITAFMIILAAPICHVLYGHREFTSLPLALQGYALVVIPMSIVIILNQFVVAQNRASVWNWFYMSTVGIFAIACAVLIPYAVHYWHNGVLGAALATGFAEMVTAIAAIIILKVPLLSVSFLIRTGRALLATLGMAGVMWLTRDLFLLIPASLGCIVFILLGWFLHILTPDEQERFLALLSRKVGGLTRSRFNFLSQR